MKDSLTDSLNRFEPKGWVATNMVTGEMLSRVYCEKPPPHQGPAEALHGCPYRQEVEDDHVFLCACCEMHTQECAAE